MNKNTITSVRMVLPIWHIIKRIRIHSIGIGINGQ